MADHARRSGGKHLPRRLTRCCERRKLVLRRPLEPGQFAAHEYRRRLRQHGIVCSMSREGDCWDNAPMESFYATLKGELVEQRDYLTHAEARADIFQLLEGWYNRRRLHSALGYITPEQKIAAFQAAASAA